MASTSVASPTSPATAVRPKLWSPTAVVNVAFFTGTLPLGPYLLAKNWAELGQPDRAAKSMRWFWPMVLIEALFVFLPTKAMFIGPAGFLFIAWYFRQAKPQMAEIKAGVGKDFERRGLMKPFLAAFGLLIVAAVVLGAVGEAVFPPPASKPASTQR